MRDHGTRSNDTEGIRAAQPTEKDYLSYLRWLREDKKYSSSTTWCMYSRLNYFHQKLFGKKLQQWPKITELLKTFADDGVKKKTNSFTLSQIQLFLKKELPYPFWILRKAIVSVAFCGGLSCREVNQILFSDLEKDVDGYYVTIRRAKMRNGELIPNTIHIPLNHNDPSICYASKVQCYLDAVVASTGPYQQTDKLFRGCMKDKKFQKQPIGKNMLDKVGKDVAEVLGLAEPQTYTGRCWVKSAATQAIRAGSNIVELSRQFGYSPLTTKRWGKSYVNQTDQQAKDMALKITGMSSNSGSDEISVVPVEYESVSYINNSTVTSGDFDLGEGRVEQEDFVVSETDLE